MKKFMKKYWGMAVLSLAFVGTVIGASNIFSDAWTVNGNGALRNTAIAWIDSSYNMTLYNGNFVMGGIGSTPSTSAGGYYGIQLPCNNIGGAWTAGDIVISSATGTGNCRPGPATTDLTSVLGIAVTSNAGAGTVGYYTTAGYALAHTTGTVAIGDILTSTSSAAAYLAADNTPTAGATVGRALSAGTAAGGNTLILVTH